MLPQALLDLIEENLKQLYDEITLSDIIYRLHACKVLSEGEVDFLNECKGKQKKNYEFIRILKTREERDFKEFCDALIDHDAEAIQNLGKKLKSNLQTTTKSGNTDIIPGDYLLSESL